MMADLADGESVEMQGSGAEPYVLKNTGGVYSCTCPAWAFQGAPIEKRTCKHLKKLRGDEAEKERVGGFFTPAAQKSSSSSSSGDAPKLLLAHKWKNDVDLAGWWMSEKLDGVRAYWNGKTFLSRLGNEFMAPKWFTDGLGDDPLDGELWVDRGEFQKTVSIVRRQDRSDQWKQVSYVVFDAPALKAPFEERIEALEERLKKAGLPHASALEHIECEGVAHLEKELKRIEALGGEGVMLRQPKSKYVEGRSTTLLKVKTFHDSEGVVVGYVAGKGKHKGRTGALIVELPDGTRFNVGTGLSDKERESPPKVGATITYRYQELTKGGVPRFPSYVGERVDVKISVPSMGGGGAKPKSKPVPQPKASGSAKPTPKPKPTPTPSAKPTPKPAGSPSATEAPGGDVHYFEREGEDGVEFWEITFAGREYVIRQGTVARRTFDDPSSMEKAARVLVSLKRGKGFTEVARATAVSDAGSASASAYASASASASASAPASASESEAEAGSESGSGSVDAADGEVRYFEFVSGTSSKFWEITQHGTSHTVRYGRIGAKGATKTKTFSDEASMQASAEKLIAQKTGKGYSEV